MFAISYDSEDVLRRFSEKYSIEYPLLSDIESKVIRDFGILNTNVPEGHHWLGVPFPGTYMVGEDGRVIDRSFRADHRVRESVSVMLQESFSVQDIERGESRSFTTPHLGGLAYFASPTVRPSQLTMLTVEVSIAEGVHINGPEPPEGYVPLELTLGENVGVVLEQAVYPEPHETYLEVLEERLPTYSGRIVIKARCKGARAEEGPVEIPVQLRYQACDDSECYLPETFTVPLDLQVLSNVRERLDSA